MSTSSALDSTIAANSLASCGSNCTPAKRRSSPSTASRRSARRYGRSLLIASNASATETIRAVSGMSEPDSPSG